MGEAGICWSREEVAKDLKLKEKPQVVGGEEEGGKIQPTCYRVSFQSYTHEFYVENSKFNYIRTNGKTKQMMKDFYDFWKDFKMAEKKKMEREKTKTRKQVENASYEKYLEIQRIKKQNEKMKKENARNPPPETTPLPETEKPPPETAETEKPVTEKPMQEKK